MRHNNLFRTLAAAIILALLIITIPAIPVRAQTLRIAPDAGSVGTLLTITGEGFASGDDYEIIFAHGTPFAQLVDSGKATGPTISITFSVPLVPRDRYAIRASYVHSGTPGTSSPSFTVTPQITLSTSSGYVGNKVTVSGTGFSADSKVDIYFDTTSEDTVTTDAKGSFTKATFTIPESSGGSHTVKGSDAVGYSPGVSFSTLSKISVTPTSGTVGDQVRVSGVGFASNKEITFYLDDEIISTGTTTTNAKGSFSGTKLTIPSSSYGSHTIKAQDASNNSATATFSTMGQELTITPASGSSGTTVTVTGSGFSANAAIAIRYSYAVVSTEPTAVNTDAKGSFTASFIVPVGLAGAYPVRATDGPNSASAAFVAMANATISHEISAAAPGHVGMAVTITGTGFIPNATVTITYTTEPVVLATVTTDRNGAFSATFVVPPSIGGNHIITVTDGNTTKRFIYVVELESPPIPAPLLPETKTKAPPETYFDWGDVSDPSGVTYTLQIAADAAFTTLVLEKRGLIASEYTLTEDEQLPTVKKEAPYYWRVKAIDGAFNESEWSAPRSFWVGFLFILHNWALYTLLVVGAGFFTYVGFLIGRRTAY
ncbi:IPT/TIG domain-containing protein [Chloroflexota bacterium]